MITLTPAGRVLQSRFNLRRRVAEYCAAYPEWPASWPHVVREKDERLKGYEVMYATWVMGADYRNKTTYYGAFPPNLLARVMAMYPDVLQRPRKAGQPANILHAFSGSLQRSPDYVRIDLNPEPEPGTCPELVGSVYHIQALTKLLTPKGCTFDLIIADPPYSEEDAKRYKTPGVDTKRATRALAGVTNRGGHLVWLDTKWPMFSKDLWRTVGRIAVIRSTNHRVRLITIFERV